MSSAERRTGRAARPHCSSPLHFSRCGTPGDTAQPFHLHHHMCAHASPRPLACLTAAMLLSAGLTPPVIRDAPGADPTMPEGGSNSVAEKLLPENKKLVNREPPAEMALSEKSLVQLPPAKKESTAEKTVAKTEDEGGPRPGPACRTNGPKTTPRKQGEADDHPEARTTAVRPCPAPSCTARLHRGALSSRLPPNLPQLPVCTPEQAHESVVLMYWLALLVAFLLRPVRSCGWLRLPCVTISSPYALPRRCQHHLFLVALVLCIGRASSSCDRPAGEWVAVDQVRDAPRILRPPTMATQRHVPPQSPAPRRNRTRSTCTIIPGPRPQ